MTKTPEFDFKARLDEISIYSCSECHALVEVDDMDEHRDWHERLKNRINWASTGPNSHARL